MTIPDDALNAPRPVPEVVAGRYRIVSRLGVGGMGVVYKAIDVQLNRSVAIKALESRRIMQAAAANRLRKEAFAAASLDHPYICRVYELVEMPPDAFIVMEFVEGETLSSMLKRGAPPLSQTLQLGREIAEGLANAHARGLVHRDVKPSNVMVTSHGHVKLLDFGIAGADVESQPKDETRTLEAQPSVHAGTPHYMAPEQASGQPVSARADLFSLGVLLYECLTGSLPFSGTTSYDYVRHVLESAPRRLDRIAPETPADLVDLVHRLLEKVPADRPESADAVVTELRRLQDSVTSSTGTLRTAGQVRTHRRWQAIAAGAILLAAAAVGWLFLWRPASTSTEPRQLRPFVTSSAFESGSRISPDGQWVSFLSRSGGSTRLMMQRVDGGEPRPLTLGPGDPVGQVWSPDGNQLAVALLSDGKYRLQVYPAFFGGVASLTIPLEGDLASVSLIRWIAQDVFITARVNNKADPEIRRMSLTNPTDTAVVNAAWKLDSSPRGVDVRRDGLRAVFSMAKAGNNDLFAINLDGSNLQQLTNDAYFDRDARWIGAGDRVVFSSNRGGQVDLWEIDVVTKALTQLSSGEVEEIAEDASSDGRTISIRQLMRTANLWQFEAGGSNQLTQDSLSDYAPAMSDDGRVVAFQRNQPTPASGFTILDARVFVSPYDGKSIGDPRSLGNGVFPHLSTDGEWLAYLQTTARPARGLLTVRHLKTGTTHVAGETILLPSLSLAPVDWVATMTAWDRSANLYFVDQPDAAHLRKFNTTAATSSPPLATAPARGYFRDLHVSTEHHRLTLVSQAPGNISVQELDPATNAIREVLRFSKETLKRGVYGRGWLGDDVLFVRTERQHDDRSSDVEILAVRNGNIRTIGTVTRAFPGTVRLHAPTRTIYLTRIDQGVQNAFAFQLESGKLTQLTQNQMPGISFSGFQPTAKGTISVREERREDLWLLEPRKK